MTRTQLATGVDQLIDGFTKPGGFCPNLAALVVHRALGQPSDRARDWVLDPIIERSVELRTPAFWRRVQGAALAKHADTETANGLRAWADAVARSAMARGLSELEAEKHATSWLLVTLQELAL